MPKEQKTNGPLYIPSLGFTYNVTPHSITGNQPHDLMLMSKAPTVSDAWLGLTSYRLGHKTL